jgi:hypothetical protein
VGALACGAFAASISVAHLVLVSMARMGYSLGMTLRLRMGTKKERFVSKSTILVSSLSSLVF